MATRDEDGAVCRCAILGVFDGAECGGGEAIAAADDFETRALLAETVVSRRRNARMIQKMLSTSVAGRPSCRRKGVEREAGEADVGCVLDDAAHGCDSGAVAGDAGEAAPLSPAAIAIHDDGDVDVRFEFQDSCAMVLSPREEGSVRSGSPGRCGGTGSELYQSMLRVMYMAAATASEACDCADEQGVVFKAQQQIDERVERGEDGEGLEASARLAKIHPALSGEQDDGGRAGDEEREIEADALGEGEQQQVEDDLRDADEDVLRGVDSFAGGDFEDEVGEEDQAEEEQYVFERLRLTDW